MTHSDTETLRAAYDTQLRRAAEVSSALDVTAMGPLLLAVYSGGRGFITYRTLDTPEGPATEPSVRELVAAAAEHYRNRPEITDVEWKTRGHDHAPGLDLALRDAGFEPEEAESVMIGEARALAADVPLPAGVSIRKAQSEADVARVEQVAGEVFGNDPERTAVQVAEVVRRFHTVPGFEMWFAEVDGHVVTTGRLEPVAGTDFAGLWGGSTRPEFRGKGIYRALTSARARSALAQGKRWLHSDSTEFSRPILERSGLVKVTSTTPYVWTRT